MGAGWFVAFFVIYLIGSLIDLIVDAMSNETGGVKVFAITIRLLLMFWAFALLLASIHR